MNIIGKYRFNMQLTPRQLILAYQWVSNEDNAIFENARLAVDLFGEKNPVQIVNREFIKPGGNVLNARYQPSWCSSLFNYRKELIFSYLDFGKYYEADWIANNDNTVSLNFVNQKGEIIKKYDITIEQEVGNTDGVTNLFGGHSLGAGNLSALNYLGGGIWGGWDIKCSPDGNIRKIISQSYSVDSEQTYILENEGESIFNPFFGIKKPMDIPGTIYVPKLFSNDGKELIYIKANTSLVPPYLDNYGSLNVNFRDTHNRIRTSSEEVYYAKFNDKGEIIEDNLILDLKSYSGDLILDYSNYLGYSTPYWFPGEYWNLSSNGITIFNHPEIEEMPFWRWGIQGFYDFDQLPYLMRHNALYYAKLKNGIVEYINDRVSAFIHPRFDPISFDGNDLGDRMTYYQNFLLSTEFTINRAQWNGTKFEKIDPIIATKTPLDQQTINSYLGINDADYPYVDGRIAGLTY